MGFRAEGTAAATILPAVLVTVLYTGQWMMMYLDGHLWSNFSLSEWRASFNRPTWIRDAIMAPITEEVAFRCCCASLLSGCLSPLMTVIVCPLPFASSHFHHIGDDRRRGFSLSQAIARRTFQFAYTYAFGAYATYLFLTTGHALAPIVTHAMCNSLGLPMFTEIGKSIRTQISARFVVDCIYSRNVWIYAVGWTTDKVRAVSRMVKVIC
ncbi:CAAX amino terminal protease family protein [Ancylostoma caninum]|uniref:CAAX prenyl protease 2 n=1 Tax=Ancylostoma caninum TaxID=29170 RepID=A0A368F9B6_ANCCA|nr:CAAX amino terminal protease family protein [Ancylostoma caninum]